MGRRVAFVTGGGRMTGKHTALKFAEAGYDVGVTYVKNADGAMDAVKQMENMGVRAKAYKADTRDIARIREVFDDFVAEFGRFDVLVNNAGITRFFPYLEATEEQFDEVVDTNLKGTYFTGQAAARQMKALGNGGVIINISSLHARGSWPMASVYATTKAGINRLTESLALELADDGIRVVCVAPGYIASLAPGEKSFRDNYDEWKEKVSSRIPLRRYAEVDEVGHACVFLASDKAAYITGSTLYIEGGALLPIATENKYS